MNVQENKLTLSVKDTAMLLSMNPDQVREAIENGSFEEFGRVCKSGKGRNIYKISKRGVLDFLKITEDEMVEFLSAKKGN